MSKARQVEPIAPGTLLRYDPKQDPKRWIDPRSVYLMRQVHFQGPQFYEVKSFVWNKDGGHVTLERDNGTYVIFGGGRIEDVELPYPHPMFRAASDAEAAEYRLANQTTEVAHLAASSPKRFKRFLEWLWTRPMKLAQA